MFSAKNLDRPEHMSFKTNGYETVVIGSRSVVVGSRSVVDGSFVIGSVVIGSLVLGSLVVGSLFFGSVVVGSLVFDPLSYLISLNHLLSKSIAHVGSFNHFVFVHLCLEYTKET